MNPAPPVDDIFDVFPWNPNFETGLTEIDEQHKRLVELINMLAVCFARQDGATRLNEIFDKLAAYTVYHFSTEEKIWKEAFAGDPWVTKHEASHKGFVARIAELRGESDKKPLEEVLDGVLAFLINWLAFHILESDMRLAKAVLFMREKNLGAAEAKEAANRAMSGAMETLVNAILGMYGSLSSRTLSLMKERTQRKQFQAELAAIQKSEKKISDAMMNSIPGILYLYDEDLRLIRWNENFKAVAGYTDSEMAGKSALEFVGPDKRDYVLEVAQKTSEEGYQEFEVELVTKDGRMIPYKMTGVSTVINETPFYAGVGIDITEEKRAERRLIASRNMLENAQRISHLGHWTLYHDTGKVHWSDEFFRILKLAPGKDEPSFKAFWHHVLKEDRSMLARAYRASVRDHTSYSLIFRLRMDDGEIKYLEGRGNSEYGEDGTPVKSVGTLHDISQFYRAQERAANEAEKAKKALMGAITAVAKALEARDPYTAGHQERVSKISVRIAERMQLSPHQIEGIRLGARIHDLGKISVPAEILSKPGRLTDLEYGLIQVHPETGGEILKDIDFPWPIREIVAQHHERLDGKGYPLGLKGDEICLEARIVAVADVFEAMSAHRPYRASLGLERAIEELEANKGRIYDEKVVDTLLEMVREDPASFLP